MIFTLEHLSHLIKSNHYKSSCKQCVIELGPYKEPLCFKCNKHGSAYYATNNCHHPKGFKSLYVAKLYIKAKSNSPIWVLKVLKAE